MGVTIKTRSNLPNNVRELLPRFLKDANARASNEYGPSVVTELKKLVADRKFIEILDLLKDHPYVVEMIALTALRAMLCEELHKYQAASMFYAMAIEFSPNDYELFSFPSLTVIELSSHLDLIDDADEYLSHQLKHLPNVATYTAAAAICFRRASLIQDQGEQRFLLVEQLDYFEKSWNGYHKLPYSFQNHPDMKRRMILCFETAGLASWRLGLKDHTRHLCSDAIAFDGNQPSFYVIRGAAAYPSEESISDFKRAISFPDSGYFAYYYLAHHALQNQEYAEASLRIEQALKSEMGDSMKGQLYGWMAVCKSAQQAEPSEVESWFDKAKAVAPHLKEIAENHTKSYKSIISQAETNLIDPIALYQPRLLDEAPRKEVLRRHMSRIDARKTKLVKV